MNTSGLILNGTSIAFYKKALTRIFYLSNGPKKDLGEFTIEKNDGIEDGCWYVSAKVRNHVTILLPLFDYFDFYGLANDKDAVFPQWARLLALKYPRKDELESEEGPLVPVSETMHDPGYADLYAAESVWPWNGKGGKLIIPKLPWARKQLMQLVRDMKKTLWDLTH